MDVKKIVAAVVGLGLAAAGAYYGVDFKGAVCGGSPIQAEPVK